MSMTLAAADTITGVAGAATSITYTIFGDEVSSAGADAFKVLAQGQLPSSAGTLYTVPGSTSTIVKGIHLVNGTGGAVTAALNVKGTAASNAILPAISILAGGFAIFGDDGWAVYNSQGQLLSVGATGAAGTNGNTVLNGSGAPSGGTGVNGDFYIDTAAQEIYGPKTGGAWGSGTSLVGTGSIIVQDEGTPLTTAGTTLNFVGTGVTATGTGTTKTITIPGGSLEVKEVDGSPDVTGVTQIIVSNGTLTDNSGGSVTITTGGAGASDYVSGVSGSGHIIIPGIAADPDALPGSPNASDDEFGTTASGLPSGWTQLGTTPTAQDANTTALSHYYIKKTGSGASWSGIVKAWSPSAGATATVRLGGWQDSPYAANSEFGLVVGEATPGKFIHCSLADLNSGTNIAAFGELFTNPTTYASNVFTNSFRGGALRWFRVVYHSSTNLDFLYSLDGRLWVTAATGVNGGFTVGSIGMGVNPNNSGTVTVEALFDYIRFS